MKGHALAVMLAVCALLMLSGCITDTRQESGVARASGARDGFALARELNRRFDSDVLRCPGDEAAYFCSGIVLRGISSDDCCFWNNTERSDYIGVSFSYLRKSPGSRAVARDKGFVLKPADVWGKGGYYALHMLCSYPYDAMTGPNRGILGCGPHSSYPDDSGACAGQGIDDAEAFRRHYLRELSPQARFAHQCSFGTGPEQFYLSIQSHFSGELETSRYSKYSEVVIARWDNGRPKEIPFEALFYEADGLSPGEALQGARKMQMEYGCATGGNLLRIVRFHNDVSMPVFTYDPSDQGVLVCPHDS